MKIKFLTILLFTASITFAQYPFEKGKAINYTYEGEWKTVVEGKTYSAEIPGFFKTGDAKIVADIISNDDIEFSLTKFEIYNGEKLAAVFYDSTASPYIFSISSGDINGDGLSDIKFEVSLGGCGLGALNNNQYYFFGNKDGSFTGMRFLNMGAWGEYDMDKDNNYEIFVLSHESINNHSYWVYNVYNYLDGKFVNVNNKLGYPLMIRHLIRDNYSPDKKIMQKYGKQYNAPLPQEFVKLSK